MDSSAKIPSGLLRGNVNQFGDFDECLGVVAYVKLNDNTLKVQGKYCLASIDLYASRSDMKLPVHLMQARAFLRGNMHDVSSLLRLCFWFANGFGTFGLSYVSAGN